MNIKSSKFYPLYRYVKGKLPIKYKFGQEFLYTKDLIKKSELWSKQEVEEYQYSKLKELILHAYDNVPYYKKLFESVSFDPKNFREINDLRKIPFLTKDIINEHKNDLIAENIPSKFLNYSTTGGSTGIPMGFYTDKRFFGKREWAYMTSQWNRIGYRLGDKMMRLRGDVVPGIIGFKKYWNMDYFHNCLVMSSYHLTEETMKLYIEKINKFQPKFIHAYPSVLQILANYIKRNSLSQFKSVQAIFLGSENIYPWQRNLFEEVFHTRIFSWYGHTEQCCMAGECELSSIYHSYPTYGFTELINDKGDWCIQEGEKGEIVSTSFINFAMPFIRYKTQDIAIDTTMKCDCGREWKIIKSVEGRLQDYVYDSDGIKIPLTALIFAQHFSSFGKIKNLQLFQCKIGEVELRIVENQKLNSKEIWDIKNKMTLASSGKLIITIKMLNEITRTSSGKQRFIIQNLDKKALQV